MKTKAPLPPLSKETLLRMLEVFVNQRPGFIPREWDRAGYAAALRDVARDKRDAHTMLRYIALRPSITYARIADELTARNRLTWDAEHRTLDYCTGQMFGTEYREAVCAALRSVIWHWLREDCGYDTGDKIREAARRELGHSIARRWFR